MSDPMEDLLDRSAPPLADRGPGRDSALRLMVADAGEVGRSHRSARRRSAMMGIGLAAVLMGGAGVAAANSDWSWSPGLENPDRSYTYTSPTWGECEIRFSGLETNNVLVQADVNRIIDEWFASTDVKAAADPYVEKYLAEIEAQRANDPESVTADPRLPDLNAWFAHEQALHHALHEELKRNGYDSGAGDLEGSEGHSQVQCENADWGGEGDEQ